jgi:hypothetical protein
MFGFHHYSVTEVWSGDSHRSIVWFVSNSPLSRRYTRINRASHSLVAKSVIEKAKMHLKLICGPTFKSLALQLSAHDRMQLEANTALSCQEKSYSHRNIFVDKKLCKPSPATLLFPDSSCDYQGF